MITLKQILLSAPALALLSKRKCGLKAGWNVSKIRTAVEKQVEQFHKARLKYIRDFGEPQLDKDGNVINHEIKPGTSAFKAFEEEMEKIMAAEVWPDDKYGLKLSELGADPIEPDALMGLEWLLIDDLEEVESKKAANVA
jgi:hypothetical protein